MNDCDISIIIVNWNVREHLERCLSSLLTQQGCLFEVFVVDNASNDASAALVAERFPQVRLIANTQNVGFARANNQALLEAKGAVLLLLNPDTILPKDALRRTVQYFAAHTEVGILGCRLQHSDGSPQRSVLRFPTFCSQALVLLKVQAFTQKPLPLQRYYALDFDYAHDADVEQVMGSFFALRRAVYDAIGPLDKQYFVWFEEVDYCRRARAAGWRVRYTPSITVTHVGAESARQLLSIEQQIIFNRSMLHYFRKHHSILAYAGLLVLSVLSYVLAFGEEFFHRWYVPKPVR